MPNRSNKLENCPVPARVTSAFIKTACHVIHEKACDYVMYVAGHGGDTITISELNNIVSVFPSHFNEWARNFSRATILHAIPHLTTFLGTKHSGPPVTSPPPELPPIVAKAVTLAIQQHILATHPSTTINSYSADQCWDDISSILMGTVK